MDFLTYLQPRSLKTRLTLLTLVIFIVSIASLLVYASAILREDMQRLVGEQQLSTATLVAAKVGQAVDERFVGLRVSAKKITPALMANPVELQSFRLSGIDVANNVGKLRADLPVAIASGFIDDALRTQAATAGVQELIFKANVADDFCAAIARLAQPRITGAPPT